MNKNTGIDRDNYEYISSLIAQLLELDSRMELVLNAIQMLSRDSNSHSNLHSAATAAAQIVMKKWCAAFTTLL